MRDMFSTGKVVVVIYILYMNWAKSAKLILILMALTVVGFSLETSIRICCL